MEDLSCNVGSKFLKMFAVTFYTESKKDLIRYFTGTRQKTTREPHFSNFKNLPCLEKSARHSFIFFITQTGN